MNTATLALRIQRGTSHALFPGAAVAAIGMAILAGAYAFQYIGGYKPCALCLEQRVPWFILIGLGGVATAAQAMAAPWMARLALYAAIAGVALWSAYLGFFHFGVEYKWWPGPADCTGTDLPLPTDISGPLSPSQIVRCDEIVWHLFGITMAGFNGLFSLAVAGIAAFGGWSVWRNRT
jgi:disulfide bond formation protein DsbB